MKSVFIFTLIIGFFSSAQAAVVSGYQGYFQPAVTVTIASSATTSGAIATGGMELVGLALPATFTGTAITFQVSTALAGTYQDLYDASGSLVSMTVAQGRTYAVDPKNFYGVQFLKIKSGSTELGARSVVLSLKGL